MRCKRLLALFLLLVLVLPLVGCGAGSTAEQETAQTTLTVDDFRNEPKRVGVFTGSAHSKTIADNFPQAEMVYFNLMTDILLALDQGKIDGFVEDSYFSAAAAWSGADIEILEEPLSQLDVAFALSKDQVALQEDLNAFLQAKKDDGSLEQLVEKWTGNSEPTEHPDYSTLTGEKGTIRVAVCLDHKPLLYQKDDACTGLEMEILTLFAREYGYALEMDAVAFEAILVGLATGKYDVGAAGLNITPERLESVLFSIPYNQADGCLVIKGSGKTTQPALTVEDFRSGPMRVGVITGSAHGQTIADQFPQAELSYYNIMSDMILALDQGKIDGYVEDSYLSAAAIWEGSNIQILPEPLRQIDVAFAFPKDAGPLEEELNTFLETLRAEGTLDELIAHWTGSSEPTEHPDYSTLTGENGTLQVAACVTLKPAHYMREGKSTGLEVDILTRFAQEYGYKLEFTPLTFDAILTGLATGKYDLASAALNVTPERMESVNFSVPYNQAEGCLVIRASEPTAGSQLTLKDFETATIGVMTGTAYDAITQDRFPDATRQYYSLMPDLILAVEQGKVDGYMTELPYLLAARWAGAQVQALDEVIGQSHAGFIFQKGEGSAALRAQLNEFILASRENGFSEELEAKWFGSAEPEGVLDLDSLTGENGTLRVAVAPDLKPISYYKENSVTGFEAEYLLAFAREYGYDLEFHSMTFDAILPGVISGKYDIGAGAITITEEREQSVDFSESHMSVDMVMAVREEAAADTAPAFWDEMAEDFEKTFIREDRWKLILGGIGVTMLISVCATLAGSALGFGLYMLSRARNKPLRTAALGVGKVYSRIVAGTPVVVILMILFYVVFGSFRDLSGTPVAILGFTLTFGAFVYDHMTVSVNSVDKGQTEAAYALGYPRNKAFFRIIFPQAMTIFMPTYCGEVVSLIKATAVVGYIAVNDLTKVGDIIRSNTYEAFFPLISTAVIYFLLTWLAAALLKRLKLRFEPKRRTPEDILKGVKTR